MSGLGFLISVWNDAFECIAVFLSSTHWLHPVVWLIHLLFNFFSTFEFPVCKNATYKQWQFEFLHFNVHFIPLSCLIVLARTSVLCWIKAVEVDVLTLFQILDKKVSTFFHLISTCWIVTDVLYYIGEHI